MKQWKPRLEQLNFSWIRKSFGNPHFYGVLPEKFSSLLGDDFCHWLKVILTTFEWSFVIGYIFGKKKVNNSMSTSISFSFCFYSLRISHLRCKIPLMAQVCACYSLPVTFTAIYFRCHAKHHTATHILTTFFSRFKRVKNARNTFRSCLLIFYGVSPVPSQLQAAAGNRTEWPFQEKLSHALFTN